MTLSPALPQRDSARGIILLCLGIAIFALVLYLLAVALDLQSSGEVYIPAEEPASFEEPPTSGGSGAPST